MKVFISWSGELSKSVAQLLAIWLPDVLQGTEAWISSDDIDKGSIWFTEIANEISKTSIGILCLTPDNLTAPWILFEAGALSKGLTKSRVCPLLIDLITDDLRPPLSQLNATLPTKADMLKLVSTINEQSETDKLDRQRLEKSFNRCWKEFEDGLAAINKGTAQGKTQPRRSTDDMIVEVLQTVRSIQKSVQANAFSYSFQPIEQFQLTGQLPDSSRRQLVLGDVKLGPTPGTISFISSSPPNMKDGPKGAERKEPEPPAKPEGRRADG